jgi:1-acyl-sn-glycerol-3-phosphate acyltransferase
MGRKFVRFIIHVVFKLFFHLEVRGLEHLPPVGAYIIASNHLGRWDVPIVYHLLDRNDIILIVAEKYRANPLWRWLVANLDAIFVDRFNADVQALRIVLSRLKKGGVFVVAPEGTRSPTGALIEGKPGSSYLAAKAGVDILPVGLTGSEDANVKASFTRLQRPVFTVTVGKPFRLPELGRGDRDAVLKEYTDEIMCRIAALLPPGQRGVYSDHPRLKEILSG